MKNFLTRRNNNGEMGFFDSAFDDFFKPAFFGKTFEEMRTDVKETDKGYDLSVDMPGYEKKDIEITLENGYITVEANKHEKEEDKNNYIRRERSMSCSRSYYVGEGVDESDVKAKYENGTLVLSVPKQESKRISSKNIAID